MKASIITPSYNACERLYYNLLSLNLQSCDRSDFEVIVVDNASTDETKKLLLSFNANFDLKPIFLNENKGRSHARNCAIDKSEGEILIFHDSDMIAEKDYICKHIEAHKCKNTAVIGQNWNRIYTYYYNEFKGYLKENFIKQQKIVGSPKFSRLADLQPLLEKEDIISGKCFEHAFILHKYQYAENCVLQSFGSSLKGYKFPWTLFSTNNCSAFKEDILKAGAFDEAFTTWGCEDLDLGYRLYMNECSFIKANDIVSIHQEHPVDFSQNGSENMYYFTSKYNEIDLLLFYYGYLAGISRHTANVILTELERLKVEKDTERFIELYRRLLINLRDRNFCKDSCKVLYELKTLKKQIVSEADAIRYILNELEMNKKCNTLLYTFRALLRRNYGPFLKEHFSNKFLYTR